MKRQIMSKILFLLFFLVYAETGRANVVSCKSIFSTRQKVSSTIEKASIGLVSETAKSNSLVIAYENGTFENTYLDILNNLNPDVSVIIATVEYLRSTESLDRLVNINKNTKVVDLTDFSRSLWTRDWVPQKVVRADGKTELVSLTYYANDNSDMAAAKFAEFLRLPHYQSWIVGEMGNIMTDGKGRLFTTEKLIRDNINVDPKSSDDAKSKIIQELKNAFSVEEVIVVPQHPRDGGIGHIDLVAKYVGYINGRETIIVSDSIKPTVKVVLDSVADIFAKLDYNVLRIQEFEDNIGKGAAGFVNSLIINDTVFIPIYSRDKNISKPIKYLLNLEKNAKEIYQSLGFKVIEVDSSEPIRGMGAVHCLTSCLFL